MRNLWLVGFFLLFCLSLSNCANKPVNSLITKVSQQVTPVTQEVLDTEDPDPAVQFKLGLAYYLGGGVTEDHAQAAHYFRKAAEKGFAPAQANLGVMYQMGNGVPQDDVHAAKWFYKAAKQGVREAQFNLAGMYGSGSGVKKDPSFGYFWMYLAAENGDRGAKWMLDEYAKELRPEQLNLMKRKAAAWQPGLLTPDYESF